MGESLKRTGVSLTEQPRERLQAEAHHEGVSMAERIRWTLDGFLAWDESASVPIPKKGTLIHLRSQETGFSGRQFVIDDS